MNWSRKVAEAGPNHREGPLSFLESAGIDVILTGLYYDNAESQKLTLGLAERALIAPTLVQRHCPGSVGSVCSDWQGGDRFFIQHYPESMEKGRD